MKLTSLSILFVIIIFPFILISDIKVRMYHEDAKLRAYYDQALDNAVQDAAYSWVDFRKKASYDTLYSHESARKIAADTLLSSLYHSFNASGNTVGMQRIKTYVPALLFLEEEGYMLYAMNEFKGPEGYRIIDYSWFPLQPYSGEGIPAPYIVRYTLGDKVYIYDSGTGEELIGAYSDFSGLIPAFGSSEKFKTLRLTAISRTIEKGLENYIGFYNDLSKKIGVTYEFRFPRIEDGDWKRALSDEGIIAFAQGLPVLTGKRCDMTAFGGARIMRKPPLAGYVYNGKKIYCKEECSLYSERSLNDPEFDPDSVIYISTAKEAAENGYYPCSRCRP